MAEYIERGAVLEKMQNWHTEERLRDCVKDFPAADVEKRVRCEDCVSSGGDRFGELICQNQICPCYGREVDHAFSCILGEQRESNG